MSHESTHLPPPLDLSKWAGLPRLCMGVGGVLSVLGLLLDSREFGYSWLLAFVFFLSIALGSLFLVMVHHLTDAGWSVATRRVCEHLATLLFPSLAILFLPLAVLAIAGKGTYDWMHVADPATNNLILAKAPVFTIPGFCVTSAVFFGIWWLLSSRLAYWSLRQDVTGAAECTHKLRFHSGWGIVAFAITLTLSSVLWIKAVHYQWYSAIYGVYFFASTTWVTLATLYVLTVILQRQRILHVVLHDHQFYYLGVLFFGFTVFQAYTEFAQYFVVWNANMPTETFYYLIRENGSWWWLSMILIFGHFLPLSAKTNFKVIVPVCVAAWFLHLADMAFNILPALNNEGYPFKWLWLPAGCVLFMGGFLAKVFLRKFLSHPPYPQRDPRVLEAMGVHFYDAEPTGAAPVNGGQP